MSGEDERQNRRCGECKLCCQAVAAVELQKPTGVWCQHVCDHGCGIYPMRPTECRKFRCLWLNGFFGEGDRPDELGVVFFEECLSDGQSIVTVSESYPGAAGDSPRVKELIKSILEQGTPVVVRNSKAVAKAYPDGRVVKFDIDQADRLKVAVIPKPSFVNLKLPKNE